MFEDMIAWGDATDNEHADTVLQLLDPIDRVLALHRPLNNLGSPPCAQCLGDDDGESVFVPWPCPTVRAIEGAA